MPCDKAVSGRVQVHLDGDMLRHVLAYDMAEGWVEHIEHDENGFLIHCDGEWSVLRRFGKVEAFIP